MTILERIYELEDPEYAVFQSRLTPNISPECFIGARVPKLRTLSKELMKTEDISGFIGCLPHKYYDENMLHGLLLSEYKDYSRCIEEVERFLPFVDNWAVCDIMSPKVFKKHKAELIEKIREWIMSEEEYTIRFGIEMLMTHYLDDDFKAEYLELPATVRREEYYVKMMIAWFYATALAKQWEDTIGYLEQKRLEKWEHNKTIQKARESFRITGEQKEYLLSLKIK